MDNRIEALSWLRSEKEMSKFSELKYKAVFVENQKIAKVRDVIIDTDEWKVTHLIVDLTKEAAKEILGSPKGILNTLAVSALEKGTACCTPKGIEIKVSKGQLHMYLRPV
jgi:sporulation protein YlmC with PRC-barrel domain